MGYRDENEALRARVEHLEAELAAVKDDAARRTAVSVQPLEGERIERSELTGGPVRAELERVLPFELSASGYEAIADLVRERLGPQVSQVGRTLTAPRFSLRCAGGKTTLKLSADWRSGRAEVLIAPLLSALLVGVPGLTLTLALTHGRGALWIVLAWLVVSAIAGGVGMRRWARRLASSALASDRALFESVCAAAREHPLPETAAPVRVARHAEDAVGSEGDELDLNIGIADRGVRR